MIENQLDNAQNKKDYNSDVLLNILSKALIEDKLKNDQELYLDENWKINSKDSNYLKNELNEKDSKLKNILLESFPNNNISVTNNTDGSQTILIL